MFGTDMHTWTEDYNNWSFTMLFLFRYKVENLTKWAFVAVSNYVWDFLHSEASEDWVQA